MIRIQQLKLPISHTKEQLLQKIARELKSGPEAIQTYQIRRQSIDARKKSQISYVYTIDVQVKQESHVLRRAKSSRIGQAKDVQYQFPAGGTKKLKSSPVIIGSGPAGLFCAYLLARHGFSPILLERGRTVDQRVRDLNSSGRITV